ncbi:Hypothetical protein SCF082_LOCUS16543 [Durusdinium trenchii]|uniref:Uncharacterized protein n=1 Tax=Durusdinium trenchii TaxID=1381693 RepID=A0ABP0KDV6_9DINO
MDRGRSPQVPLLQKLLPRLRSSDAEGSASLFPSSEVPAVELVRLAEEPQMGGRTCMNTGLEERSTDLAHLELWNDEEGLKSLGREILRRRPELKVEELQLAKGAFAMLHLNLQDVWSTVGARMTTRGGSTITQQAFAPVVREEPDRKRRKLSKDLEETSPPPSPPRR